MKRTITLFSAAAPLAIALIAAGKIESDD